MNRRDFLTGTATGLVIGAAGTYALTRAGRQADVAPAPAEIAAPTIVSGAREMKMVTTWPKNFPGLGTGAQRVADRITAMTDGQITVKVFAGGELVPPFESFDAVSGGTADMYHGAEYYWQGKSKAFNFFTAVPAGFTAAEINAWIHHGGGQALWDELAAGFNIKPLVAGNTGVQMGGWFNKEIASADDFNGLKFRMPGLGGEVMRRLGAAVVALPGGEIFPALQAGTIDGTEWVGPWNDLAFGFYKVTKFYYWPGFHEPGSALALGVNKGVWDSLTTTQQAIFAAAAGAENDFMLAEFNAHNGAALAVLVDEHGVQLRRFPDEVLTAIGKAAAEVMDEVGGSDPATKKVYDSYLAFRKAVSGWTTLSEQAYTTARGAFFNL